MSQRICICGVQVPFARGGAEMLVDALRVALQAHGHRVDVVNLPFKWYPAREVITHALPWRLIDLTESQGVTIDRVICTKFPTYAVRHPNKALWLFHQFRQAYDLLGTEYGELGDHSEDVAVLDAVRRMDAEAIPECRHRYTIAKNVSGRLQHYNGIDSQALYPPPPQGDRYRPGPYGDYVLSVGRLDAIKRVDLLLRALAASHTRLRTVITGIGGDLPRLQAVAHTLGIEARVDFAGFVSDERLLELYEGARAVFYAPYDEDYGFVTLEAMRSAKPVITTTDAGGVLEFVTHEHTGLVGAPDPAALGLLLDRLADDTALCERMGAAGLQQTGHITWETVVAALTAP